MRLIGDLIEPRSVYFGITLERTMPVLDLLNFDPEYVG